MNNSTEFHSPGETEVNWKHSVMKRVNAESTNVLPQTRCCVETDFTPYAIKLNNIWFQVAIMLRTL